MTVDPSSVASLNTADLVALFNKLAGGNVKRFSDRKAGVSRVLKALAAAPAQEPAAAPAPAAAPQPVPAPRKGRKRQPSPAAAPAAAVVQEAAEEPSKRPAARAYAAAPGGKLPRPGSKRGELLALLRTPAGVSAEEGMARFGWKAGDFKDAIYLIARKNGVSVARGEDGRWHAR